MKIANIKRGFCNNSSSTHSIVCLKPGAGPVEDEELNGAFGWEYFTAASRTRKLLYLCEQVYRALTPRMGDPIPTYGKPYLDRALEDSVIKVASDARRDVFLKRLSYVLSSDDIATVTAYINEHGGLPSIDHQSMMEFPDIVNGGEGALRFIMEVFDAVLRDDVVIIGGNDNDSEEHRLKSKGSPLALVEKLARDRSEHRASAIRAESWGYSLFSYEDGTRTHIVRDGATLGKNRIPDLVDLKITDYCASNCGYCYQGSTNLGKHADLRMLQTIIRGLAEQNVFEIAIGGGEPTQHPDIREILQSAISHGIVINFTTRQTDWLGEKWARELIVRPPNHDIYGYGRTSGRIGGVAFSIDGPRDVLRFENEISKHAWLKEFLDNTYGDGLQIAYQYVPEIGPMSNLRAIAAAVVAAGRRLTLLGYKETGRGHAFKVSKMTGLVPRLRVFKSGIRDTGSDEVNPDNSMTSFMDVLRSVECHYVGIDTALAKEQQALLKSDCVDPRTYFTTEGVHSMYIDAVAQTTGASSYSSAMSPIKFVVKKPYGAFDFDADAFAKQFASIQPE